MDITKIAVYSSPWERLKRFLQAPEYSNIAAGSMAGPDFDWDRFYSTISKNLSSQVHSGSDPKAKDRLMDTFRKDLGRMYFEKKPLARANQYLLCYALKLQKLTSDQESSTDAEARVKAAMQLFTLGLGVHELSPRNLAEFILLCCIASGLEFGDYASILKTVPVEDQPNLPAYLSEASVDLSTFQPSAHETVPSYAYSKPVPAQPSDPQTHNMEIRNGTDMLGSYVEDIATSEAPKAALLDFLKKNETKLNQIFAKNRSTYYSVICGYKASDILSKDDAKRDIELRYYSLFGLEQCCLDLEFSTTRLDDSTISKLMTLFPDTFISSSMFEDYYRGYRSPEMYAGVYFLSILYDIASENEYSSDRPMTYALESEADFIHYLNEQMANVGFPAPDFEHRSFDSLVLCAYRTFYEEYQDKIEAFQEDETDEDARDILADCFLNILREYLVQVANSI